MEQSVGFFSFCSFNSTRKSVWRHENIQMTKENNGGHCVSCHYQIDCVTNLSTAVGHYATESCVRTLEHLCVYIVTQENQTHFSI